MGLGLSTDTRDKGTEAPASESEKTEFQKLVQECQGLTGNLVRDVIGIMHSLDVLQSTSRILKDNQLTKDHKTSPGLTEETSDPETCNEAALQLLVAAEEVQLCQKRGTINTLIKLIQFIKRIVQREVECTQGSFGEELLKEYIRDTDTSNMEDDRHVDANVTQKSENKIKRKKDMQKYISHLEKENSELRHKVNRLEKQDASFYSEKKQLNERIRNLEKSRYERTEKKFEEMSDYFENTYSPCDQLNELSSKLNKAEKEIALLNEMIDSLNEENGRLTSQLISIDIGRGELEAELNEKLKDKEEENEKQKKLIVSYKEITTTLESEKATIITERDKEIKRNDKLESYWTNEIKTIRKNLQESETAFVKEREGLKEDKRIIEKERGEKRQRSKRLETEITQKSDEYKVSNKQKVERKNEKEEEATINEMNNEKRRNEEQQIKSINEIDNLKQTLQEIETRRTTLTDEFEVLKEEKRILEEKGENEAQRNKRLETELTQKSDEYEVLKKQKDETIKEFISREKKLNETIEERGEENAKLNKSLQNASDNFGSALVKLENEKVAIIREGDNEKRRIEELQIKSINEIANLKQTIQETEARETALIDKFKGLKEEKRILEEEREKEAQRNRRLETELTQKSDEHEVLIKQKDEKMKEFISREKKFNETIKEREEDNEKLNKSLQNASDNFGSALVKLENEKVAIIRERDNEKRRIEEQRNKAIDEIANLKQTLQEATALIDECEGLKEGKRISEEEREKEAQRNGRLEIEITQKSAEYEVLKKQKDEIIKEFNNREKKLNETIKKREEENEKLNKSLQNASDNFGSVVVKFENEKVAIINERDNEKRRIEELRIKLINETDNLKMKLKQKSDEYEVLTKQKDERIKELTSAETKLNASLIGLEEENAKLNKSLQNANDNLDTEMKKFETEKRMLVVERDEGKLQTEELQTQLANTIESFKKQIQQKEMIISENNDKMKTEELKYRSCLQAKEQKIKELNILNTKMQIQDKKNKDDYENGKSLLENENQRVQRQLDMLRVELKAKSDSSNKLQEEIEALKNETLKKKEHIKKINKLYEDTKLQLTNEIKRITVAQLNEKTKMQEKERTLIGKLQLVNATNNSLNDQICELQQKSKESESLITGMKSKITQIEEVKTELESRLRKRTAENEILKNELEKIKSRKVIQIQLYSQSAVGLLSAVEDELKCVLKSKMDVEEDVDIDIINCAKASDIQSDIPLIILCIQASRLGTAVASTVQGLTLTPKMSVLIFHHKDVHALPNQASERVLTGQELRNLGGIFDLAFLSGKGIYPCEMNRTNFISLINFIKREGTKKIRDDL